MGAAIPITGRFAYAGQGFLEGFSDAIDYINARGGVAGRRFEAVIEDTGYDLQKGVAAFNRILSRPDAGQILFMFGDSTGLSKAVAQQVNEVHRIPYSAATMANELTDPQRHPYIFIFGPSYDGQFHVLLDYIRGQHRGSASPKIALVYSDTEFGRDPIPYVKRRAAELGFEIVAEEVIPVTAVDVTANVLKIRRAGAEYVLTQGYTAEIPPLLMKTGRQFGYTPLVFGGFWSADVSFIQRGGAAADGFLVVNWVPYWTDDNEGIRAIKAFLRDRGKTYDQRSTYYVWSWLIALTVSEAMNRAAAAGDLSRDGVRRALERMADYNALGLVASTDFSQHQLAQARIYRANAAAGRFEPVSDWISAVVSRH